MKNGYEIINTSKERKIERWGEYVLSRPSPVIIWENPPAKEKIDGEYFRSSNGGGKWKTYSKIPEKWNISYEGYEFQIKLTGFGHTGLFPEQAEQWKWFEQKIPELQNKEILNLFAYTGGSTLACLKGGGRVTHVDAAPGVVNWAKENSRLNKLDRLPVRWLVDDVQKFVRKEIKRKKQYQGIIIDPPSFGRGPKGEIWKLEEFLFPFLKEINTLLDPKEHFFHFSCHTPGFTPLALKKICGLIFPENKELFEYNEMELPVKNGDSLPAGSFLRYIQRA